MRKSTSQVVVAIVCALLGFLLAYQFKLLNKTEKGKLEQKNTDIISEVEGLKKEKEELVKSNTLLSEELKKLEETASKSGDVSGEIKKSLDNARMHLGSVEVTGPGVTITLTPKSNIFAGNNNDSARGITDVEIVYLINLLWYSRAEAISINDFRITPQTGIAMSGNLIKIGTAGQIDPKAKITIKAIGDKGLLNGGLSFAGNLEYGALLHYSTPVVSSEEIVIKKSTQSLRTEFIKPVKE